jgi:hypothetical protein
LGCCKGLLCRLLRFSSAWTGRTSVTASADEASCLKHSSREEATTSDWWLMAVQGLHWQLDLGARRWALVEHLCQRAFFGGHPKACTHEPKHVLCLPDELDTKACYMHTISIEDKQRLTQILYSQAAWLYTCASPSPPIKTDSAIPARGFLSLSAPSSAECSPLLVPQGPQTSPRSPQAN